MTKQALRRTVGFCSAAWQASTSRWVDGVLRYVTATPGLAFRDFSFLEEMAMDELAPAPSWQGKAGGMILAFGLREDEPADATMRWIERGGVPAVSLIGPEGVVERESTCAEYREGGDVRRAVEFIHRHACEGIKVTDVVRHLRNARRTLDQHFADQLGHSPTEEIRQVRFDRARKLLGETGLSVGRVAELAGFRDLAMFNATFRQRTGLQPAEFRQREQK